MVSGHSLPFGGGGRYGREEIGVSGEFSIEQDADTTRTATTILQTRQGVGMRQITRQACAGHMRNGC